MAFITGMFLIDAPASALNMGESEETKALVKAIRVGSYEYPYVSAQAFRYWLRSTLANHYPNWQNSPITTAGEGKKQQSYTQGDPITYWDDDLLGYMRAQKKEEGGTLTRQSPFRTSTLVSLSPVEITDDFGVMARHEGNPIIHEHEFYRTTLKGLFSLNLREVGTFSYINRTGSLNLNPTLKLQAQETGLIHLDELHAYRLPLEQRVLRVQALLYALGRLEGGARQTLHYTDVSPVFLIVAVTQGGNHPFSRIVHVERGEPAIHSGALDQALRILHDDISSGIYVGRAEGFMDSSASKLSDFQILHPRQALDELSAEIAQNPDWWE